MGVPFWLWPFIPLIFLGVPWVVGSGLQLFFAQWFEVCRTHSGISRILFAVLAMPFLWLLLVKRDKEARRLTLLTWSHLVAQWIGLAFALPLAALTARVVHSAPPDWLVCVLFLLLLPISVYIAASVWLLLARYIGTASELRDVTQVHTRFDCWLFDMIVKRTRRRNHETRRK